MVHFRFYSEKVFISRIMAPITINSRICRYFLTLITINKKFWVFSIFKVLGPSINLQKFLPIAPTTHCVGGWKFWDRANFLWKIIRPIFFRNSKILHFSGIKCEIYQFTWFISYLGNAHLTQTTLGLVGQELLRSVWQFFEIYYIILWDEQMLRVSLYNYIFGSIQVNFKSDFLKTTCF